MTSTSSIDPLDARLLLALDAEPDASVLSLARDLGVARNTVHARLRRMTEQGVIRGFGRRVDPAALGYPLTAFVSIAVSQVEEGQTIERLGAVPEVVEIHAITGDFDLLAKVVARNTEELRRITGRILRVEGVARTNTTVSLSEAMPLRLDALIAAASPASAG